MSWQTINVDCFQIERMNGGVASLLDSIDRTPVEDRNVEIDSCPFRIERMSKFVDEGKTLYEGDFVKVRMDNLPVIASRRAGVRGIGLNESQGIGEETAFLCSPTDKLLLLQRNRHGASYARVMRYLNELSGETDSIILSIMLKDTALARLERATTLQSVEVSVAPLLSSHNVTYGESVNRVLETMNDLKGRRLTFKITTGRNRSLSLIKAKVKVMIKDLLRVRSDCESCVKTVKLGGRDDDGTMMIDFIKDRIRFSDKVDSGDERHLSYELRKEFLRSIWNRSDLQNALMS